MLNNDVLLSASKAWPPHTHIVTVGEENQNYGATWSGDISPRTLNLNGEICTIDYLMMIGLEDQPGISDTRLMFTEEPDSDAKVYLGRSDTKQNFGLCTTVVEFTGLREWDELVAFTSKDVGKKIPIWLSTTPPHTNITLVSCNSSSYRRVA